VLEAVAVAYRLELLVQVVQAVAEMVLQVVMVQTELLIQAVEAVVVEALLKIVEAQVEKV
jgi:hypothetical protein